MSELTPKTREQLLAELKAMDAARPGAVPFALPPPPVQPMASPWARRAPAGPEEMPMPQGVFIPVTWDTPEGEVNILLQYGPEHIASLEAMDGLLAAMTGAGLRVKAWRPKPDQGGGGQFSRGGGGGARFQRRGGY